VAEAILGGGEKMNRANLQALFPGLAGMIYMNTATMNIGSLPASQAYERGLAQVDERCL
jgi:hypothetical protein